MAAPERIPASTTELDHQCLQAEVSSDVSAAGRGLVAAAEDGPVQAMGECVAVVAVEIDKSAYFGEGERD